MWVIWLIVFELRTTNEGKFDYHKNGADWPQDHPTCGGNFQSPINIDSSRAIETIDCDKKGLMLQINKDQVQTMMEGVEKNFITQGNFANLKFKFDNL